MRVFFRKNNRINKSEEQTKKLKTQKTWICEQLLSKTKTFSPIFKEK